MDALTSAEVDVVVVGSGAAGMVASLRANQLGLSVMLIEKSDRYGGTTAVSGGGIWVPCHDFGDIPDVTDDALTYLKACTAGRVSDDVLANYVEHAPRMARWLNDEAGVPLQPISLLPDYLSRLPGASVGRTLVPVAKDGKALNDDFFRLRDSYSFLKLMGRLSIDNFEAGILGAKAPGWQKLMVRLLKNYWLDPAWRRRTKRDARLCNGQALIGHLRQSMKDRHIPLLLDTGLTGISVDAQGRVDRATVSHHAQSRDIAVRRGVILTSGGFESNQTLRDRYLPSTSSAKYSAAPRGMNQGEGLVAGIAVGAQLDFTDLVWRAPVLLMPANEETNVSFALPFFWDRGAPGSICVNRNGQRFVDEAVSYDEFGAAMIADDRKTGANLPCWMIFDANCRKRSLVGPLMPGEIKPDSKLPREWLDSVFYRADSIEALADRINVDPAALRRTITAFNEASRAGTDPEFDRGGSAYDRFWANPKITPNGSLAPLDKAPFYAIRLDLGDLGTKGGLKIDLNGQVQGTNGSIAGLYAAGNCTASIFADAYPGAGGTLGPAMTIALLAAEHVASAGADK